MKNILLRTKQTRDSKISGCDIVLHDDSKPIFGHAMIIVP